MSWSEAFVSSVRDITENGRKVLLTYDSYLSRVTLAVLDFFNANGVAVYEIPGHTSGKTQSCDVVLLSAYKIRL